jgi:hypothetical protein
VGISLVAFPGRILFLLIEVRYVIRRTVGCCLGVSVLCALSILSLFVLVLLGRQV